MKKKLLFFEQKSGHEDNRPAWIGEGKFSKSGQTIYFNNKAFVKANVIAGNYFDKGTGDEYWISGVKKNGQDRLSFSSGKINIDRKCIQHYLDYINESTINLSKFNIVDIVESKDPGDFEELFNVKL